MKYKVNQIVKNINKADIPIDNTAINGFLIKYSNIALKIQGITLKTD